MEYPSINFARNKSEQTRFYDESPGPYDKWVIDYGYSVGLDDADAEAARLSAILESSTDPLLHFGNDADDMRSTGRGINPDVNIYDLSSDPVAYSSERCELALSIPSESRTIPAGGIPPELATASREAAIEVPGAVACRLERSSPVTTSPSLISRGD